MQYSVSVGLPCVTGEGGVGTPTLAAALGEHFLGQTISFVGMSDWRKGNGVYMAHIIEYLKMVL